MATSGKQKLTSRHITRLAANISLQNMKGIAQGYLDIDKKTIAKLLEVNKSDVHAFNRDVLEMWAENNQGGDQVENLAKLLFEASEECDYMDPDQIEAILKVSPTVTQTQHRVRREDLQSLASAVRPWTDQAMKIEVAPWLRDYVVDMDELYSELIVEKIQNKHSRTFESKVSNYKELFIE